MARTMAAAFAALLLTACGDQGGNEQATGNQAAAPDAGNAAAAGAPPAAAMASFEPGQWETTVEVVRMSAPGLPPGTTPPPTTIRHCLTPEQAARPNADFLTGSGPDGGCTYEDFSMTGGRIRGTVQCTSEGATMRSTMDGQFTPTSYEMTAQAQTSANGMTMEMETRTTARRIGDCPAG